jgi:hypothetical protein
MEQDVTEILKREDSLEGLVKAWVRIKKEREDVLQRQRNIEEVIGAKMEARGAKQLLVDGYTVSYTSKREPQHTMLQPLKEYIPEDELIANGTYFPAHERTVTQWVPAKWDMQKAKKNYLGDKAPSAEVETIIKKAYLIHDPVLRITEVNEE